MITIYTDGSADNRTGKKTGGIGIVMMYKDKTGKVYTKTHYDGKYINTTSARMEILALITALKLVKKRKRHQIHIYIDNQYVVNTIEKKWLFNWISRGQQKANMDLWKQFYELYEQHGMDKFVHLHWIRGHNGNQYNELADELANKGRLQKTEKNDI